MRLVFHEDGITITNQCMSLTIFEDDFRLQVVPS